MPMWRRATFWLALASAAICFCDYLGSGLANTILVRLNPLIDTIKFAEPFQGWIVDMDATRNEPNSALIHLKSPAYGIHFASFALAGIAIDGVIHTVKRRRQP